jgi:hypothetical protein
VKQSLLPSEDRPRLEAKAKREFIKMLGWLKRDADQLWHLGKMKSCHTLADGTIVRIEVRRP